MTSMRNSIDSSRTINGQQEQQNQQEERNQEQYNEQDNYYNNYYPGRARACARVCACEEAGTEPEKELPPKEIMEQIAVAYRANINTMISRAAAGIIERALKSGMEPQTVIMAIEETGMASRPSPYYLSAVLRNWAEYGVVTSKAHGMWTTTEAKPWWR